MKWQPENILGHHQIRKEKYEKDTLCITTEKKNIVTSKLQINSVSKGVLKGVSYMMTKMVKAWNADYNSSVKYLN